MEGAVINWLIFFIIMLIIEIATVSLICIWFCIGALAAIAACLMGAGIEMQLFVFAVISLAAIVFTRPFAKKFRTSLKPTNVSALIGVETPVVSEINNREDKGEIKINDVVWSARSTSGEIIVKGEMVKGVKAFVSKTNNNK